MNRTHLQADTPPQTAVWWALAVLLGLRLVSLAAYPLTDNTEARYAEIARVMWAQGDWVTPWFDSGVPFWGKPPLSFWITAASFGAWGVNEFTARLPHFLVALGIGGLVWGWAVQRSRQEATFAVALLAGCSLMLVSSGAVMTDMTLLLGITLAMRGFWLGLHGKREAHQREGWLFFGGLAIGLLAKGPLVLVLAGLPIGLWALWQGQLRQVWRGLPWVRGTVALAVWVLPWYAMAELRTPGFLDYFLVGEHWHRFVTPGWAGDRYGGAHRAAHGTIWIYAWVALLPWSLVLPVAAWRWRKTATTDDVPESEKSLRLYWFLWALTPAVFFTMAGNILWTYVLPALPAIVLLGAGWLSGRPNQRGVNHLLAGSLWLMSALLVGGMVGLNLPGAQDWHTTKHLVARYDTLHKTHTPTQPALVFYPVRPYSASFYSQGQAVGIAQPDALQKYLSDAPAYMAVKTKDLGQITALAQIHLELQSEHGAYRLFLASPGNTSQDAHLP